MRARTASGPPTAATMTGWLRSSAATTRTTPSTSTRTSTPPASPAPSAARTRGPRAERPRGLRGRTAAIGQRQCGRWITPVNGHACSTVTPSAEARGALPMSTQNLGKATDPDFRAFAAAGAAALQRWYSPWTGRWRSTGWWNAANALTTIADYTAWTGDRTSAWVINWTFRVARWRHPHFINSFFDDNGWWALAWVRAYELTGRKPY